VDPYSACTSIPMSFVLATSITEAVLELTLYGAFTVLFSSVVYLFWSRGLLTKNRPIFFVFLALVILFLTITAVRDASESTLSVGLNYRSIG
jgi:hypothetical protein